MSEVLFNGRAADEAWSLNRGLQYGDGVFRTCLVHGAGVVELDAQLDKLQADAERLQLRLRDVPTLRAECVTLARRSGDGVLKVVLTRAGAERGYRTTSERADRLVSLQPLPVYAGDAWAHGIRVARTSFRLAAQPRLAGIKHLNRLEQVLASRECGDAAEGIVDDDSGRPLGGTRSNLFWVAGGKLRTPALDRCGVAGLTRERVLAASSSLSIASEVAPDGWDALLAADEVFLTSSLIGVCPVRWLAGREWRAPGPVTQRLMQALAHPRLTTE